MFIIKKKKSYLQKPIIIFFNDLNDRLVKEDRVLTNCICKKLKHYSQSNQFTRTQKQESVLFNFVTLMRKITCRLKNNSA